MRINVRECRLRDEIENVILSNAFSPGERLDEMVLARQFGVSRTPVREALLQLDAIGLIEIRPRRGAVVIDPGPHRVYEMFEVMAGRAGRIAGCPPAECPGLHSDQGRP